MLLWALALLALIGLALYGAKETFKSWFYRRLGPQRFAGRDTVDAKEQRGTLIWTALLVMVVPALVWGALNEWREIRSLKLTTGVVHEVNVVQRATRRGRAVYSPVVKFSFEFAGQRYQSDRVSNGGVSKRTEAAARETIAGLEVGQQVGVYVPREHPEKAFLFKTMRAAYGLPITAIVFSILLVVAARESWSVVRGMVEDWRGNASRRGAVNRSS